MQDEGQYMELLHLHSVASKANNYGAHGRTNDNEIRSNSNSY